MAKKNGIALAEPVRTTAEEIKYRSQQAAARLEADRAFYGEAVQRIAAGQPLEGDVEAVAIIAAQLQYDFTQDVDRLRKLTRWTAEGYLPVDHPEFEPRHEALFAKRQELAKERDELTAKAAAAGAAADRAESERRKFYDIGRGMRSMRDGLQHVLGSIGS